MLNMPLRTEPLIDTEKLCILQQRKMLLNNGQFNSQPIIHYILMSKSIFHPLLL